MSTFDDPQVGERWEDTKPHGKSRARSFEVIARQDSVGLLRVWWLDVRCPGAVSRHAFARDPERFRVARRPA